MPHACMDLIVNCVRASENNFVVFCMPPIGVCMFALYRDRYAEFVLCIKRVF